MLENNEPVKLISLVKKMKIGKEITKLFSFEFQENAVMEACRHNHLIKYAKKLHKSHLKQYFVSYTYKCLYIIYLANKQHIRVKR